MIFLTNFVSQLFEETEWTELVKNNYNFLVGSDYEKIISYYKTYIKKNFNKNVILYGNGDASKKIVEELKSF